MKTICAVLLAVILSFELNAQTNYLNSSCPNLKYLKLKSSENKFLESKIHAGIEGGRGLNVSEKSSGHEQFNGYWSYLDLNLTERILYFKFEAGGMAGADFHEWVGFASIGFNYRIIKLDRHLIYLFLGAKGLIGEGVGLWFVFNPKYVFMFNNWLGISAGFRYMPSYSLDQHFILSSLGVQFFFK